MSTILNTVYFFAMAVSKRNETY